MNAIHLYIKQPLLITSSSSGSSRRSSFDECERKILYLSFERAKKGKERALISSQESRAIQHSSECLKVVAIHRSRNRNDLTFESVYSVGGRREVTLLIRASVVISCLRKLFSLVDVSDASNNSTRIEHSRQN